MDESAHVVVIGVETSQVMTRTIHSRGLALDDDLRRDENDAINRIKCINDLPIVDILLVKGNCLE